VYHFHSILLLFFSGRKVKGV